MQLDYSGMLHDRDLETLSDTAAYCGHKLRHGWCKKWECASCKTREMLQGCVEQLAECDKLCYKNMTEKKLARLRKAYPTQAEHKAEWDQEIDAIKKARKQWTRELKATGDYWCYIAIIGVEIAGAIIMALVCAGVI